MQTLLSRLHVETFVLNLRNPLLQTPEIPGYPLRRLDEWALEVDVAKELGINALFRQLSERGSKSLVSAIKQTGWKNCFCVWWTRAARVRTVPATSTLPVVS